MTERLTFQVFAPHLHSEFALEVAGGPHLLRLAEVTPQGEDPAEGSWQPFELLFEGPHDPVLPQSTYRLVHPDTGPLDVFLVPVGQDDRCTRYQAVFG